MIANPLPRGETSRRGSELYESAIRPSVESIHFGKYLVLDIETGEYEIDQADTLGVIGALELTLRGLGHKFELGAGLAAAQRVFAEGA